MNIRKLFAATAIAGGFAVATSGLASADESQAAVSLEPGAQVCIELPPTADPVRAEGLADRGVAFTLTALRDGTAAEQVLAQSDGSLSELRIDANSFVNPTAFPGVVRLCAVNSSGETAFVTLHLVSFEPDTAAGAPVANDGAPSPVVVNDPAEPPAESTPALDLQAVIDAILALIDELIDAIQGAAA